MLKLTKTGIGLLIKQYKSVLRKCWAINVGIFALGSATVIMAPKIVEAGCGDLTSLSSTADIVACLNQNSVAIGKGTYALNNADSWTVAIGGQAKAKGYSSVAIGDYAQAEKISSIAIGQWARSRGNYSVALGSESFTSEDYVVSVGHSVGDLNYSSGTYSGNLYRRIVNVADGINAHDAVTLGQMNNALNYYYTKTEADARYAKLGANNTFVGSQYLVNTIGTKIFDFWNYSDRSAVINMYHSGTLGVQVDAESYKLSIYDDNEKLISQLGRGNFKLNGSSHATGIDFAANVTAGTTDASHLATTGAVNQLLNNYYYTFRVDERVEVIEFAKELRSNKKEMSSLDFMPIKSSSDLLINLIKAEDPLTFSAKTRDDSLFLMEVCHA